MLHVSIWGEKASVERLQILLRQDRVILANLIYHAPEFAE
jgi:hypothetical protein